MLCRPEPKRDPPPIPGNPAPGDAASIIFPRKSGNKLVENAVRAINTNPRINFPRCGFKYLKRMRACFRFSFEIFAFCVLPSNEILKCRDAVAIETWGY